MKQRPRITRRNKADRLIVPGATQREIECDMAMAPFDKAASDLDAKWGVDRLPELVSVETAQKWGSAMAKLNNAIASADVEETKKRVGVCIRGLAALDAEAEQLGHQPLPPEVWTLEIDGKQIAFIRDTRDWARVAELMPNARIHTMREIGVALKWMGDGGHLDLDTIRETFPRAEIAAVRDAPKREKFIPCEEVPF